MKNNKVKYLVGSPGMTPCPVTPYNDLVCEYLQELSKKLRSDKDAKAYPDVLSFAFWCRKSNIYKLKGMFEAQQRRIGRGIIFHIAPSNVPVNFAFSLVFGLLSGNGNIVRASSKAFPQVDIICKNIKEIIEQPEYKDIKNQIAVVSYERDSEITDYFSAICDARIIWGGDETIWEIRKSPIATRSVEINFADRFSFCMINPKTILDGEDMELKRLAGQFYNDTYLMDQNACSTPHLIIWKTTELADKERLKEAKEKFWTAVYQVAQKYELSDIKVSDKYTDMCEHAVRLDTIEKVKRYRNLLYVISLKALSKPLEELRGKFGEFFEYEISDLDELETYITPKVQTCVTFGIDKEEIMDFILRKQLRGIDRIVSMGSSLDIGVIWDGYDMISSLSRVIG